LGEGDDRWAPPRGGRGGLTACARRARGERGEATGPPSGPKAGEGVAELGAAGPRTREGGGEGQAAPGGKPTHGGTKREFPFSNFFLFSYYLFYL
jgi:hypothetical protein